MGVNLGIWVGTFLAGTVFGVFLRPRYLAILTAVLEVAALAGLVVCHGDLAMLFGIAAMALPLLGVLATGGAIVGAATRRALARPARDISP